MVDLGSTCQGTFEHPLNEFKGVRATRILQDFYDSDPKRGFFGGGGIDARFNFYPISFALYGLPPGTPRWGAGFKNALMDAIPYLQEDHANAFSMKLLADAYMRTGATAEAENESKMLNTLYTPTMDQAVVAAPAGQHLAENPQ